MTVHPVPAYNTTPRAQRSVPCLFPPPHHSTFPSICLWPVGSVSDPHVQTSPLNFHVSYSPTQRLPHPPPHLEDRQNNGNGCGKWGYPGYALLGFRKHTALNQRGVGAGTDRWYADVWGRGGRNKFPLRIVVTLGGEGRRRRYSQRQHVWRGIVRLLYPTGTDHDAPLPHQGTLYG